MNKTFDPRLALVAFYADWTPIHWQGWVNFGGYADINYSIQITNGGLITIG